PSTPRRASGAPSSSRDLCARYNRDMTIVCGCGRKVETQPDWAGQWISCPGCNGSLYAPFPGPKPSTPTALPGPGDFEEFPTTPVVTTPAVAPTRLCPFCAETIPVADPKCKFCNSTIGAAPASAAAAAGRPGA